RADGTLRLHVEREQFPDPGERQLLIRIEAAPINPSDLVPLLAHVDLHSLRREGGETLGTIPSDALAGLQARAGKALPVGNEGAGVVVAAGKHAEHLVGRTVAVAGGRTYAQFRLADIDEILALPPGVVPRQAASAIVNPLTAMAMLETMRREGHTALINTAAASNLGQMLNRLCLADGVDLINIVRSDEQAAILRAAGARYVLNSAAADFEATLVEAIFEVGATLAFDAVGGGPLAGTILAAMGKANDRRSTGYSRFGSTTRRQVYLYGRLSRAPTEIGADVGVAWTVGYWLVWPMLEELGADVRARLRARAAAEATTTFASHYAEEISLTQALDPAIIARFARRS
ncbi:MAG: hypothetical protein JF600_18365, partial [Xanthomonadales bacterium]|nr:hypothetical protein [Xanthomonadales bacterium]